MIEVEQLSLFTMLSPVPPAVAVCCMDGALMLHLQKAGCSGLCRAVSMSFRSLVIQWCSDRQMARQTTFRQDTGIITTPSENACSRACLWEEIG